MQEEIQMTTSNKIEAQYAFLISRMGTCIDLTDVYTRMECIACVNVCDANVNVFYQGSVYQGF